MTEKTRRHFASERTSRKVLEHSEQYVDYCFLSRFIRDHVRNVHSSELNARPSRLDKELLVAIVAITSSQNVLHELKFANWKARGRTSFDEEAIWPSKQFSISKKISWNVNQKGVVKDAAMSQNSDSIRTYDYLHLPSFSNHWGIVEVWRHSRSFVLSYWSYRATHGHNVYTVEVLFWIWWINLVIVTGLFLISKVREYHRRTRVQFWNPVLECLKCLMMIVIGFVVVVNIIPGSMIDHSGWTDVFVFKTCKWTRLTLVVASTPFLIGKVRDCLACQGLLTLVKVSDCLRDITRIPLCFLIIAFVPASTIDDLNWIMEFYFKFRGRTWFVLFVLIGLWAFAKSRDNKRRREHLHLEIEELVNQIAAHQHSSAPDGGWISF